MCGMLGGITEQKLEGRPSLAHRGPDQAFEFQDGNFWLDFYRLSITGGISGDAPVWSRNRRWAVFMNGEIYNFRALQAQWGLPSQPSDTQTVVDGFSAHGEVFLTALRGMYSIAIWDVIEKRLCLARDPLGEKPLFFAKTETGFVFGSEFKSLHQLIGGNLDLSPAGVLSFLRFGYVEEPQTIDLRIFALPRGTVSYVDNFGNWTQSRLELRGFNTSETGEDLGSLVLDVSREAGSVDVPASIAVSGGLDSVALAAYLQKSRTSQDLDAIIIDVGDKSEDSEANRAEIAMQKLGIPYSRIEKSGQLDIEDFLEIGESYDQPHADLAGFYYMQIFKYASENGRKVVFMGHGPDELFGGYIETQKELETASRKWAMAFASREKSVSFWDTPAKVRLSSGLFKSDEGWRRTFGSHDPWLRSNQVFQRSRSFLVHSYLSHNAFSQSDRLSMSFGVEARTPFGDTRLYGWAQENPSANRLTALSKRAFSEALDLGEVEYVKRQPKKPFGSRVAESLYKPGVQELAVFGLESIQDSLGIRRNPNLQLLRNGELAYRMVSFGGFLQSVRAQVG